MAEVQQPPAVGDGWNGYVWNGSDWVPRVDGSGRVFDGVRWSSAARPAPVSSGYGPAGGYPPSIFGDPHHSYGLTRQTSEDLQFIARYVKIMMVVGLIVGAITLLGMLFSLVTLGSLVTALPR